MVLLSVFVSLTAKRALAPASELVPPRSFAPKAWVPRIISLLKSPRPWSGLTLKRLNAAEIGRSRCVVIEYGLDVAVRLKRSEVDLLGGTLVVEPVQVVQSGDHRRRQPGQRLVRRVDRTFKPVHVLTCRDVVDLIGSRATQVAEGDRVVARAAEQSC